MRKVFLLAACLVFGYEVFSQSMPTTNLYLFDLKRNETKDIELSKPQFLTVFNQQGYNNQPSFFGNDHLLLTVKTPDQPQTDIYILNLEKKLKTRYTATGESEYSPMISPRNSNNPSQVEVSCVRVEQDETTQFLWKYPLDRKHTGENVLNNDFSNVGYYTWLNSRQLALFLVGEPHELVLWDTETKEISSIAQNTGRCVQRINDLGDIAFVAKNTSGDWLLKRFNANTKETKFITAMRKGVEDFVVLKDETFITAKGSKVYKFNAKKDVTWQEIADLAEFDIDTITRLAVNPIENKIVIVVKK